MFDHRKTVTGLILITAAISMAVFPVLRPATVPKTVYEASDRRFRIPETVLPHGTVNVNEADIPELCELYGIGETLAELTIEERETNGPFFYPEDLTAVKGIGIKKLSQFKDLLGF